MRCDQDTASRTSAAGTGRSLSAVRGRPRAHPEGVEPKQQARTAVTRVLVIAGLAVDEVCDQVVKRLHEHPQRRHQARHGSRGGSRMGGWAGHLGTPVGAIGDALVQGFFKRQVSAQEAVDVRHRLRGERRTAFAAVLDRCDEAGETLDPVIIARASPDWCESDDHRDLWRPANDALAALQVKEDSKPHGVSSWMKPAPCWTHRADSTGRCGARRGSSDSGGLLVLRGGPPGVHHGLRDASDRRAGDFCSLGPRRARRRRRSSASDASLAPAAPLRGRELG